MASVENRISEKLIPMLPILILFICLGLVSANTETHILNIPNYFDIPQHPTPFNSYEIKSINHTHWTAFDFPIVDKYSYSIPQNDTVNIPGHLYDGETGSILVRLNNYKDSTYNSNDLLFIKLCWPATIPIDFEINHQFIHSNELDESLSTFDMYLVIKFTPNFKTYHEQYKTIDAKFKLVIEKLPIRIPIPLEVYDIIVYLVDITTLLYYIIPLIVNI